MFISPLRTLLAVSVASLLPLSIGHAAAPTVVWSIGTPNSSSAEFEHENDADDFFYLHDGDYGETLGWDSFSRTYSSNGADFGVAEPLLDPDGMLGFERAVVGGGTEDATNIFFQLTEDHVPVGATYRFEAVFSGTGGHAITLGFNGTEFAAPYLVASDDGNRWYEQSFTAAEVNALIGSNVLTLRTDNPNSGTWAVLDYLRLTRVDPNVVFSIGVDDETQNDFELEGDTLNDAQFYVHAGDYTTLSASAGANVTVPERVRDDLAGGTEGFPRALTSARTRLDLYFQLTPEQVAAGELHFEADLFSLGGNSSHDLVFSINGVTLGQIDGITAPQFASFDFLAGDVNAVAGSNVISIERVGGGSESPWIQFDYVQLTSAVPEPSSALMLALGAMGLGAFRRRRQAR